MHGACDVARGRRSVMTGSGTDSSSGTFGSLLRRRNLDTIHQKCSLAARWLGTLVPSGATVSRWNTPFANERAGASVRYFDKEPASRLPKNPS